jgi:protein-tyrosine phosphatase
MIDIHTHILPGVDDGSPTLETSIEMIKQEIMDGVKSIILTPHVQSRVQKVDLSEHQEVFETLKAEVLRQGLNIDLYLGAEIFYRSHLDPDYQKMSLASSKYLLVEFSPMIETPIEDIIYDISRSGFIPIVAHVERYQYLKFEDYYKIKNSGALLQMNASAILGLEKNIKKGLVQKLLKAKLIDFVATDTHHPEKRPPNLKLCYELLKKSYDESYLNRIFYLNQLKIIKS